MYTICSILYVLYIYTCKSMSYHITSYHIEMIPDVWNQQDMGKQQLTLLWNLHCTSLYQSKRADCIGMPS